MTIKYKTFLIGILSVVSIIGITIIIFNFSYFGYINKEEEKVIIKDFKIINYILQKEEDGLQNLLVDWGQWDDTYEFIEDKNQDYIDSNLSEVSINDLNLNSVIYLDKDKKIVCSAESGLEKEDSEAIVKILSSNQQNFDKTNNQKTGLLYYNNKVYISGTLPITSSNKRSESNGTIIMIREIDDKIISYMEKIMEIKLQFYKTPDSFVNKDDMQYINTYDSIIAYSKRNFEATKAIEDINGEKLISINIIDNYYGTNQVSYFLTYFILRFLLSVIVILIIDIIVVDRYILKRLSKLIEFMKKVRETKDTKLSIEIPGEDEFSKLADATNEMLSHIDSSHEKILFLSYSDRLTGLKNRAYMEKILDELNENTEANYYIIMGDINGLKLINDALGYSEGNKLICFISKILEENCTSNEIVVSRWGGDEFVILIKNGTESSVMNLIDKISKKYDKQKEFQFKISVSFGYAGSNEKSLNTESVINLAEERMYRNKLFEEKSARSAIINSLLKTLQEKSSETEEHTIRIKNLSIKLGKKLGLTKQKLDELELLSLLHDIGKIGIPEDILMKPSKLTKEEWEIIKTHSAIGFRIASSTPELSYIANNILAHHERYDGTGYPSKLKGEEIPLLSRIITVVDSYDVMANKRVYKEAYEKEYIIEELKRCSGTQFDPYIIKEFLELLDDESAD